MASDTAERPRFGIEPYIAAKLLAVFDATPNLDAVWIYGSRARGDGRKESDIDLAVDAQDMDYSAFVALKGRIEDLDLIYRLDIVHLQEIKDVRFRGQIERDRKIFWQPRRQHADTEAIGSTQLKPFQTTVLARLGDYLAELKKHKAQSDAAVNALRAMEGMEDVMREAADFPKKTWAALKAAGKLPPAFAGQPHSSRFDGAERAIPNICLKVPTGGGKTLLAAASVGKVFSGYLSQHTGLVLWIVPNEAIYRQTLKTLSDRDHPYRQMLNVAGAGRVKILEKDSPLTRLDVESHLCVMLLMLQSAARRDEAQRKLKAFRDRGNVLGFTPREDDIEGNWTLLQEVPNLDVYAAFGQDQEAARRQKGSIVKSSLGNVLRLIRPMVVIDEGHHAYTENALRTLDGFNPCFMLELSATPRIAPSPGPSPASGRGGQSGSNILVDVRGTDLDEAEMIKLPIHVDVRGWPDWQSCLASAVAQLGALQQEANALQAESSRYIRPMLLVQVERTGKDMRDAGYIHAEDAKAYLMQLGFSERQIAIKTSDKDELKQPENIDLLSPACEIRAIITKQALQEGWDCPFAYVLCALAAGREVRAMTQLTGRILRQPHVLKTGRPALDACYVICHDARTGEVVKAIKQSLETEGMGDLAVSVSSDSPESVAKPVTFRRRTGFEKLRIFLPRVTWVDSPSPQPSPAGGEGAQRRELCYESDIVARVDWEKLQPAALAQDWAPGSSGASAQRFDITLDVLEHPEQVSAVTLLGAGRTLDRARLVRGLLDIAPNAWWVWSWVTAVTERLLAQFPEHKLAAASASLLERLRVDVEAERDRLAQQVFEDGVRAGRIEFALRADRLDYEIPAEFAMSIGGQLQALTRDDGHVTEKSLFEPAITALVDNDFERDFACYLDGQAALTWWHRNVAKAQYGLQGWKRNKVYPDFVFARMGGAGPSRMVVMETKGLHLAGSDDTAYKQGLLQRLSSAFRDERYSKAGTLALEDGECTINCDLLLDQAWQGSLAARYFTD